MMFFIIGNPRSGTSLFRLLLTSHTDIHIPPECGFMLWWRSKYGEWEASYTKKRLNEFLEDLMNSKKIEFWNLNPEFLKQQILSAEPTSYAELCEVVYRHHAAISDKPMVQYLGDKNNFHIQHVSDLHRLYPDAKFVHIIRDGRDVATSYQSMKTIDSTSAYRPNLPTEIKKIAKQWSDNIKAVRTDFSKLPAELAFEIRYEDLVESSDATLKDVCEFLNLPYQTEMLEFYLSNQKMELEPEEFKAWKHRTFGKIDNKAIGKYLNWPQSDITTFECVAGDILSDYGYAISKEDQTC